MTGYLRAARACRVLAAGSAVAAVWLIYAGHPWWACLPGWTAGLGFLMGRFLNLGHNSLATERRKETRAA